MTKENWWIGHFYMRDKNLRPSDGSRLWPKLTHATDKNVICTKISPKGIESSPSGKFDKICIRQKFTFLLGLPDSSAGKESAWGRDRLPTPIVLGFPCGSVGKESACSAGDLGSIPGLGRSPWRRERLPTPVFWPGKSHELYSPWGHKELDTTERLSLLHFY